MFSKSIGLLCFFVNFHTFFWTVNGGADKHDLTHVSPLPMRCDHWSYQGQCGEDEWGTLAPVCAQGGRQSPIDIDPIKSQYDKKLTSFKFSKGKGEKPFYIKNNGHSVVVHVENEYFVEGGGLPGRYQVAQFHFHWGSGNIKGSEHLILGHSFPLEMHIVTFNRDKYKTLVEAFKDGHQEALAVLGLFAEVSETNQGNEIFEAVSNALGYIQYANVNKSVNIDALSPFLDVPNSKSKYFRYNGSLTTPTCNEIVVWTVFADPIPITEKQLKAFQNLFSSTKGENAVTLSNNYRRPQLLNARTVYRSFEKAGSVVDSGFRATPGTSVLAGLLIYYLMRTL